MKALVQRVSEASVTVDNAITGKIGNGMLVLLAVEKGDGKPEADWMVNKLLNYRLFADQQGKMNCNIQQAEGDILLVSQFTLAADTNSGNRPSFTPAAEPEEAKHWYQYIERALSSQYRSVATGVFAADMKVALVNDGPVTFMLQR